MAVSNLDSDASSAYLNLLRQGRRIKFDREASDGSLTVSDTRLIGGGDLERALCGGTGSLKNVRTLYDESGKFLWFTVVSSVQSPGAGAGLPPLIAGDGGEGDVEEESTHVDLE